MKIECSKVILGLVMISYFFGVIFGAILVKKLPEMLGEYLTYLGAPVAVAIAFYSWKAKAENVIKLTKPQAERIENL